MRCIHENSFKGVIGACAAVLLSAAWISAQTNPAAATVEFTHPRYTVKPTATTVSITLRRTGNTNSAVSVEFATADETAVAGADYIEKKGPIHFAAGQTEQTFNLPLVAISSRKSQKTLRIVLSNPTAGASLGARSTSEVLLPKVWNTGWLNFGLDHIEALKETWLEIPLWQYLASLIYIFLAFYISKLFDFLIRGRLRQWARRSATPMDDLLLELLRGPIKVVLFVIFLHIGLRVFAWPDWLAGFISKGLKIIVAGAPPYYALKVLGLV